MNRSEHFARRVVMVVGVIVFLYAASIGPWLALMNRDTPTNERVLGLAPIYYPVDLLCNAVPPLEQLRRAYCNVWYKIIPSRDVSE